MTLQEIPLSALTIGDLKKLSENGTTVIIDGDKKVLRIIEDRRTKEGDEGHGNDNS